MKILVLAFLPLIALGSYSCWKDAYGRGVGRPISTCAPGM